MINFVKYLLDRHQGKAPKGAKRSKKWWKVRRDFLRKNPKCAVCESTKNLEVHHIVPFYMNTSPDMELSEDNLITLCQNGRFRGVNCHLLFGHLGNWRNINPSCVEDAWVWSSKINGDYE